MLEKTCNDPQLLVDIFVNYDCDLESTNLFQQLVRAVYVNDELNNGRY